MEQLSDSGPIPHPEIYLSEQVTVLMSCVLSAIGCILIICSHALWPELRSRPRELLLYLSVADLLSAIAYAYGVMRNFESTTLDCVAQGALSTFANTSSFFWTVAVALYLYINIVHARPDLADRLLFTFHIISWGVPLIITVLAVVLDKIGYDASYVSVGWCWVKIDVKDRVLWMLLAGKLWEILAYLILPILYILIKKHINRAHDALSEYRPLLASAPACPPRTAIADKKLIFIPLIFIALRIWSTVRFILTLYNSPAVDFSLLVILHGIGNTFQGGANCIMFVLCTAVVRQRLFSCSCCRPCMNWLSAPRRDPSPPGTEDSSLEPQVPPRV